MDLESCVTMDKLTSLNRGFFTYEFLSGTEGSKSLGMVSYSQQRLSV